MYILIGIVVVGIFLLWLSENPQFFGHPTAENEVPNVGDSYTNTNSSAIVGTSFDLLVSMRGIIALVVVVTLLSVSLGFLMSAFR